MIDFRKLLIAQMIECAENDGGWPRIDGGSFELTAEEIAAYDEVVGEANAALLSMQASKASKRLT